MKNWYRVFNTYCTNTPFNLDVSVTIDSLIPGLSIKIVVIHIPNINDVTEGIRDTLDLLPDSLGKDWKVQYNVDLPKVYPDINQIPLQYSIEVRFDSTGSETEDFELIRNAIERIYFEIEGAYYG